MRRTAVADHPIADGDLADSGDEAAEGEAHDLGGLPTGDEEEDAGRPFAIAIANVTAWSSAQRLLDACRPDAWLLQETTHAGADAQVEAASWAANRQWKLAAGAGLPGKRGARAGADVAAPLDMTQGRWPGQETTELWPGRCTAVHLSTLAAGGIAVASVYAAVGMGYQNENLDLCDALEEAVAKLDCLWVIGGDWNMPPAQLRQFAIRAGGVIVAPDEPTCDAGRGESTIDYFIVHQALEHLVTAVVVNDGLIKTHRVVKLVVNKAAAKLTQWSLVRRPAFPVDLPVGPARIGPVYTPPAEDATLEERAAG